jgi:hypothetical protein
MGDKTPRRDSSTGAAFFGAWPEPRGVVAITAMLTRPDRSWRLLLHGFAACRADRPVSMAADAPDQVWRLRKSS